MQADAQGPRSDLQHASCLVVAEALPGEQQEQLPVALAERREGSSEPGLARRREGRLGRRRARGHVLCEAFAERALTTASAALVGQRAASHAQQPDALVCTRDLLEPAPRDHEDLGEHVVGIRTGGAPTA